MAAASAVDRLRAFRFGAFELRPQQRLLLHEGKPVRVGARAFDLLCVLVQHGGEVLDAATLRHAVWRDDDVAPNNLRVQLTGLRKLLGAGAIELLAGQGWRFAWPVEGPPEHERLASPPPPSPGNLPPGLPFMLGRDAELTELLDLLERHQRVTLAGSAGVGKTTLALAAAARAARRFAHGVWQVDFTALTDGSQVLPAVAAALGIHLANRTPLESLVRSLADRSMLMLFDNCEHVIGAVTTLADALVRGAPRVTLLATSRQPLSAAGEQLLHVAPLRLPVQQGVADARRSGAVALFEARARAADPRFDLTDENLAAVIEICRHLEGVALSIVLAATRVPVLGISGLREALCLNPDGPLQVLHQRGAAARHASLQGTLNWSYALLSPAEQAVLRSLGLFSGSFGLDAVIAVCADDALTRQQVMEAVDGLIHHSLVSVAAEALLDSRSPPRYTMHLSVRVYARHRLEAEGSTTARYRRFALHYARVVEGPEAGPGPFRKLEEPSLPDVDHDNLRQALHWAIANDADLAVRIAGAAARFWRVRGHYAEGLGLGEQVLALPPVPGDAALAMRCRLRMGLCGLAYERGHIEQLQAWALEGVADYRKLGMRKGVSQALFWYATARHRLGDVEGGLQAYRESGEEGQAEDDDVAVAHALLNVGRLNIDAGRLADAQEALTDALARYRRMDSSGGLMVTHQHLGDVAFVRGDWVEAEAWWLLALAGYRESHRWPWATVQQQLGCALARMGRQQEAQAAVLESLRYCRRTGFEDLVAQASSALASVLLCDAIGERSRERAHQAALLLGAADQLCRRLGHRRTGLAQRIDAAAKADAARLLGETAWQNALSQGARLTPEAAVAAVAATQGEAGLA